MTATFFFGVRSEVTPALPLASIDERKREAASDIIRMGAIAIACPIVFGWTAIASARKRPRAVGRFAIPEAFRDFADEAGWGPWPEIIDELCPTQCVNLIICVER